MVGVVGFFFFFQAEDGIRDADVTGVQTCALTIWATKRRCDWDNLAKLVCDALNGIAWRDDDQIAHALVVKGYDAANPRTEVTVQPHPAPEAQDWTEADDLAEAAHLERLRRTKGEEPA